MVAGGAARRRHGGGDADGVGERFEIVWRSFLPYDLAFETEVTRVERPQLMEGSAKGELIGTGRWRLFSAPTAWSPFCTSGTSRRRRRG